MKSAKITPYLLLVLLCFCGCTILENIDEISILGDYSREKDSQHRLVKTINDHYDALSKAIEQGHIGDYKDKASWGYAFGDPLLKKDLSGGTQRWLYRHAIYRLSKDKVYVYFDRSGKMIKWERLSCPKFF
jgi:hypothetical protein